MGSKPVIQDSYDSISDADLRYFEESEGFQLPSAYVQFLRKNNGGGYSAEVVAGSVESPLLIFFYYALKASLAYADLLNACKAWRGAVSDAYFPFASDAFGNPFCMRRLPDARAVYMFDHETSTMKKVSKSLAAFLASVEYDTEWNETERALHAAECGDVEVLMKMSCHDLDVQNERGVSPLCVVSASRQPRVAEWLVDADVKIEHRSHTGKTPLAFAANSGAYDVCKVLIDSGANLDSRDNEDSTPLLLALAGT